MPPPPAASCAVGDLSDEGIPNRTEDCGRGENEAHRNRRQSDELIVEKQQQTYQR